MTPRWSDTDACPGALRLHAAADGMLARVRLPGGLLSGAQLRSLRELAEEFGDGGLELTSRANLQLRALREGDAPALAARLRSAGLLPSQTHDNVRNIAAPPLCGSPLRALVGRLDLALQADASLAALPGKFLFAIGQVPLAADVAAIPVPPPAGDDTAPRSADDDAAPCSAGDDAAPRSAGDDATPCSAGDDAAPGPTRAGAVVPRPRVSADGDLFAIRLGGHDTGLRAGHDDVVPVLLAAAHAFLAEREAQRSGGAVAWRLRELADGPARVSARVVAALGVTPVPVEVATPAGAPEPGDLIGVVPQADGLSAVGALVPLGRLDGVPLRVLENADLLIVTPWRGVVVPDLAPEAAEAWADRLTGAGLAVAPGSPWSGVTACAGRPGCAKSLADVRADATTAARFIAGLPVHWVGCARACGSPAFPHVRAEATADGYLITHRPADDEEPGVHVPAAVRQPAVPAGRSPVDDRGPVGPSTPSPRPARISVLTPATTAADDRQAATAADGRLVATAADDRPVAATADGRPVATAANGRPVAATANDQPVATTANDQPVATTANGRLEHAAGVDRLADAIAVARGS
ncbi:nitrite/sulfite reductase [Actinoplanes sp. NPDC026670]|uniref:nitrite/sulfite reductase n=1 Tax=Actinoplanes sp. NPDC026670 TaxID=3154700 RepID=UPI0033EDC814